MVEIIRQILWRDTAIACIDYEMPVRVSPIIPSGNAVPERAKFDMNIRFSKTFLDE
jgi:hypothetical protein